MHKCRECGHAKERTVKRATICDKCGGIMTYQKPSYKMPRYEKKITEGENGD